MLSIVIPWYKDWDMWGAFGQWAGAIATFLAVLVALKQSRDAKMIACESTKPHLDVTSSVFYSSNVKELSLTFTGTNTKHFPIYIKNSSILLKKGNRDVYFMIDTHLFTGEFEKKVEPGDTIDLKLPIKNILEFIKSKSLTEKNFNFAKKHRYTIKIEFINSLGNHFELLLTFKFYDDELDNGTIFKFKEMGKNDATTIKLDKKKSEELFSLI